MIKSWSTTTSPSYEGQCHYYFDHGFYVMFKTGAAVPGA